jgi:3-deoxy-D-manno-octulosonic-acid transferase
LFFLYSILYSIAIFFLFPFEYLKRPADLRKRWVQEKFGFLGNSEIGKPVSEKSPHPPFAKGGQGGIIWVHAVSVGEVIASVPLLKSIRAKYPSRTIFLSTITDTGQKVARERAPEGTTVVYLPLDIPCILRRALRTVKPELLIIMETELWPNLLRICSVNKIPVLLMNGRISENSFWGYRRISFFMKKVLSYIQYFGMQNDEYAERIKNLGVENSRVMSLGNLKFDSAPPSQLPEWTKKVARPVLIAGSTNEGEEELITSVFLRLKEDFSELSLIIAPRHPERFAAVEHLLKEKGLSLHKCSELGTLNLELPIIQGIILLDTVGELSAVYGIADIAIIGKSFRGYGGQNPFEPASWGKAIICGPHMENFPVIKDFYNAGAAIEVSEKNLHAGLKELLMTPEKARAIGSKAQELYRKNSGAVGRAMKILDRYL